MKSRSYSASIASANLTMVGGKEIMKLIFIALDEENSGADPIIESKNLNEVVKVETQQKYKPHTTISGDNSSQLDAI